MPDSPDTTQAAAEPQASAGAAAPASATVVAAERPQLASFSDALHSGAPPRGTAASNGDAKPEKPAASVPAGESASQEVSKPAGDSPQPGPDAADPPESGESASPEASKPEDDANAAKPDKGPTRRGAVRELEAVTTERDALAARVRELEAASAVPEHVMQAAVSVRLTDAEFSALQSKLTREDLTGEYLTAEEREKFSKALQAREWSAPWYADAKREASEYVQAERAFVQQQQADGLAPVLRDNPYIEHAPIERAQGWEPVYRHLVDSGVSQGRALERAELQPKLDEANGKLQDLEAELSGLRVADAGRGRPLERGGLSGAAHTALPDYRTSRSSDLFAAAIERDARRSQRRAPARAAS